MKKISWYAFSLLFLISSQIRAELFNFETQDGVQMVGEFLKPANPNSPVLILLHGLGSNKEEFEPFAKYLNKNGIGVLYYDQRGHGNSILKKSGEKISYQSFTRSGPGSEWEKMADDVESAAKALEAKHKIQRKRIGAGGASIGANVAFRYAATRPETPFAVLLSPGIIYAGLTTQDLIAPYGTRPLLLAASRADSNSLSSVKTLRKSAPPGAKWTVSEEPSGHGVQMFQRPSSGGPSPLEQKILNWIRKVYVFK